MLILRSTNEVLRAVVSDMDSSARQTAAAARQVSVASQMLSSGASEQAAAVEETGTSLEEIAGRVRITADNARRAKELAAQARSVAEDGNRFMSDMRTAMSAIDASSAEVAKIVKSIDEQGKLTPELAAKVAEADTKARLEDLYLPYKPKRRTRAQAAREAGLEPLALALLGDPTLVPDATAAAYVDAEKGIADVAAALEGARWILVETFAEDAELVGGLRQLLWERGEWVSTVVPGKEEAGNKFSDYFNASELVKNVPSHRALALFRGRKEEFLRLAVVLPELDGHTGPTEPERRIAGKQGIEQKGRAADTWLLETVRWTWKFKLAIQLESEVEQRLREQAEADDHERQPGGCDIDEGQEDAEEHQRASKVADEDQHQHCYAPDHEQGAEVLEGRQGNSKNSPGTYHQNFSLLAQVARQEDHDAELCDLGWLESDWPELNREVGVVGDRADAWHSREEQQTDSHRRDHVAVSLENVVVAEEDDRG
jgi:hypothetical protein